MRLTVLGCGSAFSAVGANAGYCLDGTVLVDCGCPAHLQLPRAGIDVGAVRTVLLTHFHADHTFMLPLFLGARALACGDDPPPLRVAGPPGTREYVLRILRTGYGQGLLDTVLSRLVLHRTGYRVRAHAVVHSTGPSYAYAVTGPDGATVGFSGDTTLCAGLRRVTAQSDLMVCECTGWDEPVPSHLWRPEVDELMQQMPKTVFLLSHLVERRSLPGALVAHDLLSLDVLPPGSPLQEPPVSVRAAATAG